ncbi:alpha/beta hydrolase [Virgisporangium aliadipatigenens]|uniref:Alpha/beta hydrolase n=1 Tax=Virgisporangium aliadipatigenens TaxID=741659 RepID=A0A8J3YPC2_9ACTN|nr:alpha/beta hydrolase [Virgisporangium aliadipatigenens]GIJ47823.1 alpha/beta hydrolase [Virgisporangium aliadipatigenens]
MSVVHANGIAMHTAQLVPTTGDPEPPTAVMIHGMAGDSLASWYLTLAAPVGAAGLRVLMYDLRGHGRSERPPTGYALHDFVDDLHALLRKLDVRRPVHLLGNSFGGTIAFSYAIRHPDAVASLTAVESAPPTTAWFQRIALRLNTVHSVTNPGRRAAAARAFVEATSVARDLPASPLPGDQAIAAISCPVLCVYGGTSRMRDLTPQVRRLLPHAEVAVVPDVGHSLLITRPAAVRELVVPWLLHHTPKEAVS